MPSYCTEDSLKHVFNCFGHVENVYLNRKPEGEEEDRKLKSTYFKSKTNENNSFKAAFVVFGNTNDIHKSLN